MPRSRKIRKYADFEIPTEIERSELEVVIGTPDHSGRWTTRAMYKHHTALRVRRLTGSMALSKQNRMTPCHEVHISSFVFINRKLHEFFFYFVKKYFNGSKLPLFSRRFCFVYCRKLCMSFQIVFCILNKDGIDRLMGMWWVNNRSGIGHFDSKLDHFPL